MQIWQIEAEQPFITVEGYENQRIIHHGTTMKKKTRPAVFATVVTSQNLEEAVPWRMNPTTRMKMMMKLIIQTEVILMLPPLAVELLCAPIIQAIQLIQAIQERQAIIHMVTMMQQP
jgi:hypothetical protein